MYSYQYCVLLTPSKGWRVFALVRDRATASSPCPTHTAQRRYILSEIQYVETSLLGVGALLIHRD
jgi:hypothetical protein